MRDLVNKLPIFVCCLTLSYGENNAAVVSVALASLIFSLLSQVSPKKLSLAIQAVFIFLCVVYLPFFAYFPLILYDILGDGHYYLCAAAVFPVITVFIDGNADKLPLTVVYSLICLLLQQKTALVERLHGELIKTRDSYAYDNILLEQKNLCLRESQDSAVHIATLKERGRIAREIHDNVGHMLSRSILQVGALQVIKDEELRSDGLKQLGETLNSAMTSIKNSVHNLHDDSIDLKASVRDAVKPIEDKGIKLRCETDISENVPDKIKLCFISIVKEGISNIIKHSNADSVTVILREHPAFYQLVIEDNGKNASVNGNGIGLMNMKSRIEELDGIINITAGKEGFRIFITVKRG